MMIQSSEQANGERKIVRRPEKKVSGTVRAQLKDSLQQHVISLAYTDCFKNFDRKLPKKMKRKVLFTKLNFVQSIIRKSINTKIEIRIDILYIG